MGNGKGGVPRAELWHFRNGKPKAMEDKVCTGKAKNDEFSVEWEGGWDDVVIDIV